MKYNTLYRCRATVGYKFFNSSYMVVFDESQIANINMTLNWEPNFTNMNSQVNNADLMSYATNSNTCSVSIIDPYFTGIAWPSLLDVAGQAIGNASYLSSGILLPPCEEGQTPIKDKCWRYEKFDPSILYGEGNQQLRNILEADINMFVSPMLFISLWYETPNGYTFGTDYLYRVMGTSISHGNEYPMVTISGMGNYGVVFQDRLLNVALDNKEIVEKELEKIAERNGFQLQFCKADYSEPLVLDRKVIKSNVTIRDLFNSVIREELKGDMLSPPVRQFLNTLHVCTRADSYQGCSVFYLGKPLYENYKITATVDPTFVGKNITFSDRSMTAVPGQRTSLSQFAPEENFLKDDSWELVPPPPAGVGSEIKNSNFIGDNSSIEFESGITLGGSWCCFLDDRKDYFANSKRNFIVFIGGVEKREEESKNPGLIGEWDDDNVPALFSGEVVDIKDTAEKGGKIVTIKTSRVIALRDKRDAVVLLDVFYTYGNVNLNPDIILRKEVKPGEILGIKLPSIKLTLTFHTVIGGTEKIYLEPGLAMQSFDKKLAEKYNEILEEKAKPSISSPSQERSDGPFSGTGGGDEEETPASTPTSNKCTFNGFIWPTSGTFTSGYGPRGRGMHRGVDIAAPVGTPIYAAAPGTVTKTVTNCATIGCDGWGNYIIIDHGNGYTSLYAHLQSGGVQVRQGQKVCQGEQIGLMGSSGRSTGPHLHFEIKKGSNHVNPGTPSKNVSAGSNQSIYKASANSITPIRGGTLGSSSSAAQPGGQPAVRGQSMPGRSGFTIEVPFKGVPRALRILPKFTVLSVVTKYSEWLEQGLPQGKDSVDPGVWVPEYFKNWLISTVQYNWTQGDLRCTVNALSAFGVDNESIVPSWDQYQQYMKAQGALNSYKDYIRGFGDLCWEDENGQPSCHSQCALTEDFIAMFGPSSNTLGNIGADGSVSSAGCVLDNGKINISADDREVLRRIALAESGGEVPRIPAMAAVIRAIYNRKMTIEAGARNDYITGGKSDIRSIVFASGQFQPTRDGSFERTRSAADFADADKAIQMAFDFDALRSAGISEYILSTNNFRAVAEGPDGNWADRGQAFKGHLFGRDNVQNRYYANPSIQNRAFAEKYGKCERPTSPQGRARSAAECLTFNDVAPLATFIEGAESRANNYNAVNTGERGRGGPSTFSSVAGKSSDSITLGEVMDLQKNNRIYAVGRYQLIPNTLNRASQQLGLNRSTVFNKATQDRLFIWLITAKRPEIGNYLIGQNDDLIEAAQGVAREWAGISISKPEAPYQQLVESNSPRDESTKTPRKVGQSLYHGYNNNRSAPGNQIQAQTILKQIKGKIGNRCKATTSTSSSRDYRNLSQKKAGSDSSWNGPTRGGQVKGIAVTVGHFNQTRGGAAARNSSDIDERTMNRWIFEALVSLARSRGINIVTLTPEQSQPMSLGQVGDWLAQKRREGYYSFEIHNDQNSPGGRTGMIIGAGKEVWEMDRKLANEFGYFPRPWFVGNTRGETAIASRGSAILEVYSMHDVNKLNNAQRKEAATAAAERILRALYP